MNRLNLVKFWGTPFTVVSQVLKQNQHSFMLGAVREAGKDPIITDHVWIKKIPGFSIETGDEFEGLVKVHRYSKGYGLELCGFANLEV